MSRILFRADASAELGFGHVARTCALIEAARAAGHEPIALFGGDLEAVRAWVAGRVPGVELGTWSPIEVQEAAEQPGVRALVLDGPALSRSLMPALPHDLHTIVLDDLGALPGPCSVVVNHNSHAPELSYPHAHRSLLGRRYLMLREDIRRHGRGACTPVDRERLRVVITFGGSDPVNATARTLRLLPARELDVVVILGPGYRGELAIEQAILRGHRVEIHRAPDDPGALFAGADAAICSAGGTLGELAFLGCPALAYAIVADQLAPARHQLAAGLIAGGRSWLATDDATLRDEISDFIADGARRAALRTLALATADADGARRIIEEGLAA